MFEKYEIIWTKFALASDNRDLTNDFNGLPELSG